MKYAFIYKGREQHLEILDSGDGFQALFEGSKSPFAVFPLDEASFDLEIDGQKYPVHHAKAGSTIWLHLDGRTFELKRSPGRKAGALNAVATDGMLRSPMPGQVREVMVKSGSMVQADDALLLLEAMKMEMRLQAPFTGRVLAIHVKEGASVEKEQLLIEIEPEERKQ